MTDRQNSGEAGPGPGVSGSGKIVEKNTIKDHQDSGEAGPGPGTSTGSGPDIPQSEIDRQVG